MMSEVNDTDPTYVDDGDSDERIPVDDGDRDEPPAEWEDEDTDTEVGNDNGEDDSGDDVGAPA